ncbi:MAG: phosphoribosylanthranilate isomerase [bacterium]
MSNAPLVKICGLTNLEDTLAAIEMGADLLGFNFYPESPRYLAYEKAEMIFQEVPPNILKVGVFVNEDIQTVIDLACQIGLDYLQFHGDESPEYCNPIGRPWFKAIRLADENALETIPQYDCEWILIDAAGEGQYGGTGKKVDWELARRAKNMGKKILLAGGLNPENVQVAIATVQPFGVDVASGVEKKPGQKDLKKMEEFIAKAKSVNLHVV